MPNIIVPIRDTHNTIIQPVVKTIVEELMFTTAMVDVKDIIYTQRVGKNLQKQNNKENEALRLETNNLIEVVYSIEKDPTLFDNEKLIRDYLPIFENKSLGISLIPMHSKRTIEIELTYRTTNFDDLVIWINDFQRLVMHSSLSSLHSVFYNLTIPDDIQHYLTDVWDLTEKVAPYNRTFKDFIAAYFVQGIGIRANANDSNEKLILAIKNTACRGVYTTPPPNVPTTTLDPPKSEITFTYTLDFEQPIGILLNYQKLIHNQLLDISYLYQYANRLLHDDPFKGNATLSGKVINKMKNQYGIIAYPKRVFNESDGWVPKLTPMNYGIDLIIPIQLNLNNLRDVLAIDDFASFNYPQWMIDLLKSSDQDPVTHMKWVFFINLFEVNENEHNVGLTIGANGNIISNYDLNPRYRHYLVVFKYYNLYNVNLNKYQKNPDLLKNIFSMYLPNVSLNTLGNNSYVTDTSIKEYKDRIGKTLYSPTTFTPEDIYRLRLVSILNANTSK